jgi:hypothetical protein
MTRDKEDGNDIRVSLTKAGIAVALLASITSVVGAWFVIPYRLTLAEAAIAEIRSEQKETRERTIRIDENVKRLLPKP